MLHCHIIFATLKIDIISSFFVPKTEKAPNIFHSMNVNSPFQNYDIYMPRCAISWYFHHNFFMLCVLNLVRLCVCSVYYRSHLFVLAFGFYTSKYIAIDNGRRVLPADSACINPLMDEYRSITNHRQQQLYISFLFDIFKKIFNW